MEMTEQEFNKQIGAQLRIMRKARKISREAIGKELNVGKDFVGKMERGEQNISTFRLTKWVRFLEGEIKIGGEKVVENTLSITQKTPGE